MKKYVLLLFWVFCMPVLLFATHNRAGEITYKHISAYTYEITLTTYTYTPSAANESRSTLPLDWGDGTMTEIPRISVELLPDNYSKNVYKQTHMYPGAGTYRILMEDPNRNQGVENIFESVNIPFSIATTLRIDPVLGNNSTPVLLNPPLDKAALGQKFVHNPAAYDLDGDSLSYKLIECTGQNGEPIPNYTFPAASNQLYVDALSGELVWDAPTKVGVYNVAMVVEEWRKSVKIGQVIRDIQIEVYQTNNKTPLIEVENNVCIRVGDTLKLPVVVSDANNDFVTVTASGGPLDMLDNKAVFVSKSGTDTLKTELFWVPSEQDVRKQVYTVVIKAIDQSSEISLAGLQYVNITVVGNPPTITSITPNAIQAQIQWNDLLSKQATSYSVYRSVVPKSYTPTYCEMGLPTTLASNYEYIGSATSQVNTYTDTNNGYGLSSGFTYCYRMVAHAKDSAESYISDEVCISLPFTAPIITNVSVIKTAVLNGEIEVKWTKSKDFDAIQFPAPYLYKLYAIDGTEKELVATNSGINDTTEILTNCNTKNKQYVYHVDFISTASGSEVIIGSSAQSSSPFITLQPLNAKISLQTKAQTPWINDSIVIYRKLSSEASFDSLSIVEYPDFVNVDLQNLLSYDYYIKTIGHFDSPFLPKRVENLSQIATMIPQDTIPPNAPEFSIQQNCDNLERLITWVNPLNEDIADVIVYFKSCTDATFNPIVKLQAGVSQYTHKLQDSVKSMAGCYYVAIVDSAGNESSFAYDTCMYNCPQYILPNIFTPNVDGQNEIYHPYKVRFVEEIDIKIYDAWGELVWATTNPQILWDGTHRKTKKMLPDGVFYYVCDVFEYWADCKIQGRTQVGFIHKFSDENKAKNNH